MSKQSSIQKYFKKPRVDPGEDSSSSLPLRTTDNANITSANVSSDEADATDLLLDSEPLVSTQCSADNNSNVAGPLLECHQSTQQPIPPQDYGPVEVTLGSASGNDRASGSLSQGPPSGLSEINEKATQPHLKKFPDRVISGKTRSFSSRWYDEFKWIEYSRSRDAIFCKACRHFPGSQTEYSFVRNGFQDWKHLRQACLRHASGKTHTVALGKLDAYRESHMSNSRGMVLNQLHGDAFVQRNKEHLKAVLDIVMLCAKQDIALRGHRESSDALNKGNFLEMFKLLSRYDPAIEARLKELPRNSTLMSPDVQNELLGCAVTVLLQKIRQELHVPNTYYAILADEYKDVSKQELVAVCVRYFHAGVIKERAIGFMNTSDLTAAGISEKILQLLEPLELDPLLCVGMCFDGAAVMSGNHGGVHVILKRTFPNAIYVHCCSHRLNLVLSTVASASGHISTFFETLNSLRTFTNGAQRHAIFLEIQKEMHPHRQTLELERPSDTRWSSRASSVSKVLQLLDVILEMLAQCSEKNGETKFEADSLLHQVQTKKFLFLLVTFGKLFETTEFATRGLQSSTLSVTDTISLIENLKLNLVKFRDNSEGDFEKVMKLSEELMTKYDISEWDVSSSRKRKLPSKFSDSVITSTLGKTASVKSDMDLRQIWNIVLDAQISEMNNRFQENTYSIMKTSATCLPGSTLFGRRELLEPTCRLYGLAVEDAEFTVFIQHFNRKMQTEKQRYPTLVEVLDSCPMDIFSNINALLRVMVTLPMTTCTVERLFFHCASNKDTLKVVDVHAQAQQPVAIIHGT